MTKTFTVLQIYFAQDAEKFSRQARKNFKNLFFSKNLFSSVRSSGYQKSRYDDPAENVFARNPKFFTKFTKMKNF